MHTRAHPTVTLAVGDLDATGRFVGDLTVGLAVGLPVGGVGTVGRFVGDLTVGLAVGLPVGGVGRRVGDLNVGLNVGLELGGAGLRVGLGVGLRVGPGVTLAHAGSGAGLAGHPPRGAGHVADGPPGLEQHTLGLDLSHAAYPISDLKAGAHGTKSG